MPTGAQARTRTWGVLGVPSSVAAHWPGIEQAPAALREAGMGVAHMLDLPGCVPELAGIGPRRPLLQPADLAFVGFGDDEEDVNGLVPTPRLRGPEVIADPVAAGRRALTALPHRHLVVHFDVDVLDALDLPLADIATYGTGMRLDHVAPLLRTLVADPRVVGMTVVEANPDHDPDGTSIRRLVTAVAAALAERVS